MQCLRLCELLIQVFLDFKKTFENFLRIKLHIIKKALKLFKHIMSSRRKPSFECAFYLVGVSGSHAGEDLPGRRFLLGHYSH